MNTSIKATVLLVILAGVNTLGCDDEPSADGEQHSEVSAIVSFHGDPAVDGCGWLIQRGERFTHP